MANICPECGKENNTNAKFCKGCGAPLDYAPTVEKNENNNSSNNILIIAIVAILCVLVIGALALSSMGSENSSDDGNLANDVSTDSSVDTSDDSNSDDDGLEIISGTISTGSGASDKTYCDVYVGSEHAGESVEISVLYSRDGDDLNQGKIVPKTVSSDGYVSVPSADAFEYYPDYAVITIYDGDGNKLDTKGVSLEPESGSQSF